MDKSMLKYIVKRILISIVTLFVILSILFLMTRLLPGTPFNSEKMSPEQMEVVKAKYGLDKPVIVQFGFTIAFFHQLHKLASPFFQYFYHLNKHTLKSQFLTHIFMNK